MLTGYTEKYPGVVIVHVNGVMTCEHMQGVEQMWHEELEKRPEVMALELKGVLDIDSITINRLFKLAKKAAEYDVKLVVYDSNEQMINIFEIVKLNKLITVMSGEKFYKEYIKNNSPESAPQKQ